MDARPHTILGRPVEVMRAYPRQSPVELKTLQVSRVSVAPMGNIRVCLDASKIGRYFEHPQFGAIYSVTPKNIEGDLFVDYQE